MFVVKVKISSADIIKAKLGINQGGKAQKFFTSECAKAMNKYVPYDRGILADYKIAGKYIIYDQEYAEYQYNGISKSGKNLNYQTDHHPLATHHWDEKMWSAEGRDIVSRVQRYIGGK